MITAQQLAKIFGCQIAKATQWVSHINHAMEKFGIDTPMRHAHFLAQIGHESGRLRYVRELASGKAYEGRKDLGNTQPGDGVKYKGRGLIQITGRANYQSLSDSLGVDFVKVPEFLEKPEHAAMSAAWFWHTRKLNDLADQDLLTRVTKKVNGGLNGLEDRRAILEIAKQELGA
jgi:putative chitinase